MAAGFACLNEVAQPGVHETLDELTSRLAEGLLEAAEKPEFRWSLTTLAACSVFSLPTPSP